MNLILTRIYNRPDGIFSCLQGDGLDPSMTLAWTLEHAYGDPAENFWQPKIPPGIYTCVRGLHRLASMLEDFETFEITGVAGHTNLLFHWGNWNRDSEGCVLLGRTMIESSQGDMVTESRTTFAEFMQAQTGLDEFLLTVVG